MKITAVILPPSPASFLEVGGLPVIVRLVLTALRCGAMRVVALGGNETARLRATLNAEPRCRDVEVIDSRLPALGECDRVAILPADCIATSAALETIFKSGDPERELFVPGTGIVVAPPHLIEIERLRRTEVIADPPSGIEETLPLPSERGWCMRIRDIADASAAEDRLVADLRAATVESDGPIARFDRALSTRLSRRLARTPLRPNHITLAGTVVGLAAAWCISSGTYAGGLAGALLFWIAVIVDGCDGEVARLKMQESRFGYLFDVITDNIVHAAIFVAIGVGQYRAAPTESHVVLAVLLMSGLALALVASYVCLIRHPPVQRLTPRSPKGKLRKRLLLAFEAVMNRDFAYVLLPLALLGRLNWFLWGAGFGSHAFTLGLFVLYRWRDEE